MAPRSCRRHEADLRSDRADTARLCKINDGAELWQDPFDNRIAEVVHFQRIRPR